MNWLAKTSTCLYCPKYNLDLLLDITLSTNLKLKGNIHYDLKTEEIKKVFAHWSKRVLTSPFDKLVVTKSLVLAKYESSYIQENKFILCKSKPDTNFFF